MVDLTTSNLTEGVWTASAGRPPSPVRPPSPTPPSPTPAKPTCPDGQYAEMTGGVWKCVPKQVVISTPPKIDEDQIKKTTSADVSGYVKIGFAVAAVGVVALVLFGKKK